MLASKAFLIICLLIISVSAKDQLSPGECLTKGQEIDSANGCFKLIMQGDGNLVIYRQSNGKATWSSGTSKSCSDRACMQGDGNFVTYCGNDATWSSKSSRNEGSSIFLQGDGNLVIYAWSSGRAIWSSKSVTWC